MRRLYHLFFLIPFAVVVFISFNDLYFANTSKVQKEEAFEVNGPLTVRVVLERIYMDGEKSEEIVEEQILSMEDFWAQYADWELITQNEDEIIFQKYIDDISPLLKANGYFGIQEDGTLSIFNGKPTNGYHIIQSFFQIDVGKLESHKQTELKEGIPIKNKNQYLEVIEAFKSYSIDNVH
ncbi:intercompartmental signaling factor BofC [Bacillus kexueae]|uniref:intercompartmental signaling factor BofC n=1 Tax=Aeribacillus kexueae TaxID=2078952 RepID=UPI001FAFDCFB|nr:intercompartmental signaling factor BofC [Bacillus kexueae]